MSLNPSFSLLASVNCFGKEGPLPEYHQALDFGGFGEADIGGEEV